MFYRDPFAPTCREEYEADEAARAEWAAAMAASEADQFPYDDEEELALQAQIAQYEEDRLHYLDEIDF